MRQRTAMGGGLGRFLQRVKRTGADIAIDDAEGADGGCGGEGGEMAGGCNWRTGHWRPHWHRARRVIRWARSGASLRRDVANYHGVPVTGKLGQLTLPPKTTKSSGGIPRTSNQSNLASRIGKAGSRLWGAVGGNQARFADDGRRVDLAPATRRQEASKFGHACCEQSLPTGRISRRSPLARAWGTLASTVGAKPGKMVNAVAMSAAKAIAESALIMTVPCHGPFGPSFRWMDVYPPQVSGRLRRALKMVSSGPSFVSSPRGGRNIAGSPRETRRPRNWFIGRSEIKSRRRQGTRHRLPGRPGRVRRVSCPVSRFIPALLTPLPTAIWTWSSTPSPCATA